MDNRGQLLLAGALLLSVVIVGSIVLLNGAQFADSTGSDGSQDAVRDAERLSHMIEQDVEELVRQVRASNPENLSKALQENLSTYNRYYSAMQISDGAVFVNLSLDVSASRGGLIDVDSGFKRQGSGRQTDWQLVDGGDSLAVFEANVTKLGGNSLEFIVTDANDSTDRWEASFSQTGDEVALSVPGRATTCTFSYSLKGTNDEFVQIDAIDGVATGSDGATCEFDGVIEHVSSNYTVEFSGADSEDGSYRIGVSDGIRYANFGCTGTADIGESGCAVESYLVTPAINISYSTPELTYETMRFIDPEVGT